MPINYQYARADGSPDWTVGQPDFQEVFNNAADVLRFHKGAKFVIIADGKEGPERRLWDLDTYLKSQLDNAKVDEVIRVKALRDNFLMAFRRHQVDASKAEQLIAALARRKGMPYVWGGLDCSGLVLTCVQAVTGILLPHNAAAIRDDSRMQNISRDQAKMGDFLFIDRDSHGIEHHIATLLDTNSAQYPGGWVVWDTQPHSTSSPSGWPNPYLGTGVQIRPAFNPWYDGNISSYGRLKAING